MTGKNAEIAAGVRVNPLPYAGRLEPRRMGEVDLVVIHCTELPDLAAAREYGERILYPESGCGHCGHFYIDRDGHTEAWVGTDRVAHHVRGFNHRSIGIELVNRGRWPHWLHSGRQDMAEAYPEEQLSALTGLLDHLQASLPGLGWIAGHEHLDRGRVPASDDPGRLVYRKRDPGPMFPWPRILSACTLQFLQA